MIDEIFAKETHDGCFGCVVVAGPCSKMGCIGGLGSLSIYVLVDIHNVKIDRDLVAPCQVVGSPIKSFDMIMLEGEYSP